MSLIHQVLKDLENRKNSTLPTENLLAGLPIQANAKEYDQQVIRKMLWLIIGASALVLLLLGPLIHYKMTQHAKNMSLVQTQVIKTSSLMNKPVEQTNPDLANSIPAILTGVTLQAQNEMTYLHLLINKNILYRINLNKDNNQLLIILEHAQLPTVLPAIDYTNTAINKIKMVNTANNQLKIIINLNKNVLLSAFNLVTDTHSPAIKIDLFQDKNITAPLTPIASGAETGVMKKQLLPLSLAEQYHEALQLASVGNIAKSINLLAKLNLQVPDDTDIRQSLATLLLEQHNYFGADKVLQRGLAMQPSFVPFIELQARAWVEEGRINQAVNLLKSFSPVLATHPDYYAFLAALYEREGQALNSADLYQQLLSYENSHGRWWIGLAISLDDLGRHAQALEAYHHAQKIGDLTPALQSFAQTKTYDG
jgi:tetratricopeptide (TPR) repeat protein